MQCAVPWKPWNFVKSSLVRHSVYLRRAVTKLHYTDYSNYYYYDHSKRGGRGALDVLHDVSLQRLLVVAEVLLHQAPQEVVALFIFC
jgi:hypothetical protein